MAAPNLPFRGGPAKQGERSLRLLVRQQSQCLEGGAVVGLEAQDFAELSGGFRLELTELPSMGPPARCFVFPM